MGCKKHKYKKVIVEDTSLVRKMNNGIQGLAGKYVAVKKRGWK